MSEIQLCPSEHVHFIGIGGVSMSGLALALARQGYVVSGSDKFDGSRLEELRQAGVRVVVGHAAENLGDATVVIYNTAIRESNPERQAAVAAGLPLHHRSLMLAWMLRDKTPVAITGTHGKTTTTAMIATILVQAGLDPTAFVGGEVNQWGTNFRPGSGPHIVFEACESDGTFVNYPHCNEVISSVEPDHLDQHNNFEALQEAFGKFLELADPQGFVVWGQDCPHLRHLISRSPARTISFGIDHPSDYTARDLALNGASSSFELVRFGLPTGRVCLCVPGRHNILNALSAIAAAEACGVSLEVCCQALAAFRGTGRRFELLGKAEGLAVYDDYAHHPTEIRATLAAARSFGAGRTIAIFQPHLYSRTRDLMEEFSRAFAEADVVFLTSIYAAREDPMPGVSSEQLAEKIQAQRPGQPVFMVPVKEDLVERVAALAQPGDLILTIGAGDIRQVGEALAEKLTGRATGKCCGE